MNYRHIYHAGSFTDVLKHLTLIALLQSLERKPTAFCYLETHAGPGLYDLTTEAALKTKESELGIKKLWGLTPTHPLIQTYFNIIRSTNQHYNQGSADLRFYPGSPLFAKALLRAQDQMILCELEKNEYHNLHSLLKTDKQIAIHHQDGLVGLRAHLPPKAKRGLILLDSAFEQPQEIKRLLNALKNAQPRFTNGIYAIWYPIKNQRDIKQFHASLKASFPHEVLIVELNVYDEIPNTLAGSGLAIINPPYQLMETLQTPLAWLWKSLTINNQGNTTLRFLK